jgi:hypothetical protein
MHPMFLLVSVLLQGGPSPATAQPRPDRPAMERRLVFDQRPGKSLEGVLLAPAEITPPLDGYTLYQVDQKGSRKLADRVGAAQWAPDGAVLFIHAGELIELASGHTRRLASGLEPELALDPSGRQIAVVRALSPIKSAIEVLDRKDGKVIRRLVAGAGWNNAPLFAPDGKTLLFVSTRTNLSSIWRVGLDGAGERQLTNVGKTVVDDTYVPPMERTLERRFEGKALVWGSGIDRWELNLVTLGARRLEGGAP